MHAARALQQQRLRREEAKSRTANPLTRRLERDNKHVSSGSLSTINNWYLEKMEERQAAVIAARKRARGLNLSHVFAIMALVGAVFILVSLFITVVALLETGIVILIFGLIFTICCHFEGSEMINFDETFNDTNADNEEQIEGDEVGAKNSSETRNGEVVDAKQDPGSQVSPSRFVIEIIPEEPEDAEYDNDNVIQQSADNVTIEIQDSIKPETTNTVYEPVKEGDVRVTIITKGSESIVAVVKDSQYHANEMAS